MDTTDTTQSEKESKDDRLSPVVETLTSKHVLLLIGLLALVAIAGCSTTNYGTGEVDEENIWPNQRFDVEYSGEPFSANATIEGVEKRPLGEVVNDVHSLDGDVSEVRFVSDRDANRVFYVANSDTGSELGALLISDEDGDDEADVSELWSRSISESHEPGLNDTSGNVLVAGTEGNVTSYDAESGDVEWDVNVTDKQLRTVSYAEMNDIHYIYTGSDDGDLYKVEQDGSVYKFDDAEKSIRDIESADNHFFVASQDSGTNLSVTYYQSDFEHHGTDYTFSKANEIDSYTGSDDTLLDDIEYSSIERENVYTEQDYVVVPEATQSGDIEILESDHLSLDTTISGVDGEYVTYAKFGNVFPLGSTTNATYYVSNSTSMTAIDAREREIYDSYDVEDAGDMATVQYHNRLLFGDTTDNYISWMDGNTGRTFFPALDVDGDGEDEVDYFEETNERILEDGETYETDVELDFRNATWTSHLNGGRLDVKGEWEAEKTDAWWQRQERIEIDSDPYLQYAESEDLTVHYYPGETDEQRSDVTDDASIDVNDTSVVEYDEDTNEITATSDTSINDSTEITATYEQDGENFTDNYTVVVAREDVTNLEILPAMQRFSASLQDDTIKTILIATMAGTSIALITTSFAGVAVFPIVIVVGWFGGYVGTGIMIVSILISLFVGLNLANNLEMRMGRGGP